jgi:DNA-binding LytR/AlgR family response regulator
MTSTSAALRPATALIAEDEPLLAAHLQSELQRQWPALGIVATVGNGALARERLLTLRPDIGFLDIRMPGPSGLDVAQALAEDWPDDDVAHFPLLVFVTAYDQYAVEAFERQAVDYLLKPVTPARLHVCIQRIQERLQRRSRSDALETMVQQLRTLVSPGLGATSTPTATGPADLSTRLDLIAAQPPQGVTMVPIEQVCYFEAADKYVRVVTADQEHLIRLSLKELLAQIDTQRFWQIHRSIVVQARCISRAQRDEQGRTSVILHQRPERLPVSRVYAHLFRGI